MIWTPLKRLWTPDRCERCGKLKPSRPRFAPFWRGGRRAVNVGNTIQVGAADDKIRVKNDRIVVAGATDRCCCGGVGCDGCVGTSCTFCGGCTPDCFTVVVTGVELDTCQTCESDTFTGTDEDGFDITPLSIKLIGTWSGGTYELPQVAACDWKTFVDPFPLSLELYENVNCTGELFCTLTRVQLRILYSAPNWTFSMGFIANTSDSCNLGQANVGDQLFASAVNDPDFVCADGYTFANDNEISCPTGGDTRLGAGGTAIIAPCCE